jgi:hypothetical protein
MKINLHLIVFVIFFLLFAWDMEHTRNFITWIYLLIAFINALICGAYWAAEMVLGALMYFLKKD